MLPIFLNTLDAANTLKLIKTYRAHYSKKEIKGNELDYTETIVAMNTKVKKNMKEFYEHKKCSILYSLFKENQYLTQQIQLYWRKLI